MKLSSWMKGAMLVTVSALLIFIMMVLGCLAFTWYISKGGTEWNAPIQTISDALTPDSTGYSFTGEAFLEEGCWAMLLNEEGKVVWSYHKPEDVPEEYSLPQVATFTRWYLNDYPVRCWVRDDGLLVVGSPKGSVWKQDFSMDLQDILQLPFWILGFFLLALGCVLVPAGAAPAGRCPVQLDQRSLPRYPHPAIGGHGLCGPAGGGAGSGTGA